MQPIAGQYPIRFEEINLYNGLTIPRPMNEELQTTYYMILISHTQNGDLNKNKAIKY
jgi:hypothetical protein